MSSNKVSCIKALPSLAYVQRDRELIYLSDSPKNVKTLHRKLQERHAAGPRQHLQPPPSTPAARHSRKSSMRSSQLRSRIILLGAWVMGLGRGFCSVPPSPRPAASSPLWIVLPGMHLQAVAPTLSADDTPPGCSCKGGPGRSRPMRRGSEQPPIFRGEGLPPRSRRLAGTYPAPAAQNPIANGPRHFAGLSAQRRGSSSPHRHCYRRSAESLYAPAPTPPKGKELSHGSQA